MMQLVTPGSDGSGRARALPSVGLAILLGLAGCGRTGEESLPDMSRIRGEPIESSEPTLADEESAPSGPAGPSTEPVADGELVLVGFDRLSGFEYVMPETMEAAAASGIPDPIRRLDGREVGVKGFMLPVKVEGGLVTEFLLMRDQSMCCFGVIPKLNEWVAVKMMEKGVKAMMDQPVTVFGRMHVGEVYENGMLAGIYRLDGFDLAGPLDL